jgi:hypothetical protein
MRRIGSSKSYNFLNDSNLSFQDINETDCLPYNKINHENQVLNENGLTNRSFINLNKSFDSNKYNQSEGKSHIKQYFKKILVFLSKICEDLSQRLKELEKSNLHLKRMIQLVINDPVTSYEVKSRLSSASGSNFIKNPLGPPV